MKRRCLSGAILVMICCPMTAWAANPFSDVPKGHWAYEALEKLSDKGIVVGYGDNTYRGDKTLTRYEMAQLVANALAKGKISQNERLVMEFSKELDALGVRVTKLEKQEDQVKITGNIRLSYDDVSGSAAQRAMHTKSSKTGNPLLNDDASARLRTRIWLTGQVNENWNYVSMIENNQYFIGKNESGDGETLFQRAYLEGDIGVVHITAGRQLETLGEANIYNTQADTVKFTVPVGKTYFTGAVGKFSDSNKGQSAADTYYRVEFGGRWGAFHGVANYIRVNNLLKTFTDGKTYSYNGQYYKTENLVDDVNLWTAGGDYSSGKWNFGGMYLYGQQHKAKKAGFDQDGFILWTKYGGAKKNKEGSWGLFAQYFDQAASTMVNPTLKGHYTLFKNEGFKGWELGGNLTLAKNMVAEVQYYDLKGKKNGEKARTWWSQLVITF